MSKYGLVVLSGPLRIVRRGGYQDEVLGWRRRAAIELCARLLVVPHDAGSLQTLHTLSPLCFTQDDEMMMEINRKRLVVYNLEGIMHRLLSHLH